MPSCPLPLHARCPSCLHALQALHSISNYGVPSALCPSCHKGLLGGWGIFGFGLADIGDLVQVVLVDLDAQQGFPKLGKRFDWQALGICFDKGKHVCSIGRRGQSCATTKYWSNHSANDTFKDNVALGDIHQHVWPDNATVNVDLGLVQDVVETVDGHVEEELVNHSLNVDAFKRHITSCESLHDIGEADHCHLYPWLEMETKMSAFGLPI